MSNESRLDDLYGQARDALKARDFDRAADLLTQILSIDENYEDASRLLARAIRLKRRRWYSHPAFWGSLAGFATLAAVVLLLAASPPSTPPARSQITASLTAAGSPTPGLLPTASHLPLIWKRLSIGQELPRDTVYAIAVDPTDPDVIYAGMKRAGIFKSIDGGISWQPALTGLTNTEIQSILVDPLEPHVLYVGTLGGTFKTWDGGEHWQKIGEGYHLLMDPQDRLHIYARNRSKMYVTTDGGDHWVARNIGDAFPGDIIAWAVDPQDGQTLYAGTDIWSEYPPGIYRSRTGGRYWTRLDFQDVDPVDRILVTRDTQGNVVLYADSTGGLYISEDEGATWIRQDQFCESLITDPVAPWTVYCGFFAGLVRTADNGHSWIRLLTSPIEVVNISRLDQGNRLIAGGAGIFISTDEGMTWESRNNGLGIGRSELRIDPLDDSRMYLAVYSFRYDTECTLYRSTDGGRNWSVSIVGGYNSWCGPSIDAAGTLYLTQNDRLLRSSNGGATWIPLPETGPWIAADPHVSGRVISWDGGLNVYTFAFSDDAGISWETVGAHGCFWDDRLLFPSVADGPLYAIGCDGGFRSWSSGQSWAACESLPSVDSDTRAALDPRHPTHIYAATRGNGVFASMDACQGWDERNAGLGNLFVNSIVIDPGNPNNFFAGTQGGVFLSLDSGANWNEVNAGLLGVLNVYSIALDSQGVAYAATPYGIFRLENR